MNTSSTWFLWPENLSETLKMLPSSKTGNRPSPAWFSFCSLLYLETHRQSDISHSIFINYAIYLVNVYAFCEGIYIENDKFVLFQSSVRCGQLQLNQFFRFIVCISPSLFSHLCCPLSLRFCSIRLSLLKLVGYHYYLDVVPPKGFFGPSGFGIHVGLGKVMRNLQENLEKVGGKKICRSIFPGGKVTATPILLLLQDSSGLSSFLETVHFTHYVSITPFNFSSIHLISWLVDILLSDSDHMRPFSK